MTRSHYRFVVMQPKFYDTAEDQLGAHWLYLFIFYFFAILTATSHYIKTETDSKNQPKSMKKPPHITLKLYL